ncbi:MAG: hypothetical protein ACK5Q5_06395 [Planctomycetaceae bacterium]
MTGLSNSLWNFCLASGVACGLLLGCQPASETRTFTDEDNATVADEHNHDHAHEGAHGPHEGHIIELGGEDYHAELTMDAAARKLTIYLLQADMKSPLPVDAQSVQVRLKHGDATQEIVLAAQSQASDGEGKASQFQQTEGELPESIKDAEGLEGEVVVSFGGTQYRGAISHDHDHEGHDH